MTRIPRLVLTLLVAAVVAWPAAGQAAAAPGPAAAEAPAAAPALAPFVKTWFGHTRSLRVRADRTVRERASSGCCDLRLDLSFRVTRATGTVRHGAIHVRVTRVRIYKSGLGPDHPRPHRGDTTVLQVRRGVLTDPITGVTYCNRAASRRGVCGA